MKAVGVRIVFRALAVHLTINVVIALAIAWLIFKLWFPSPYRYLAGGGHLFLIVVGADLVCGPVLTAVLYNSKKSCRELIFDLSLVVLVQLVALGYGLYSIALARPVVVAFEVDRMVVVSAAQIDPLELSGAPPEFQSLSWSGPVLVGTRTPVDANEMMKSVELSMQGVSPASRPSWWIPYEQSQAAVRRRMKPLAQLRSKQSVQGRLIVDDVLQRSGLALDEAHFLPLVSQRSLDAWSVVLNNEAQIVGYMPVSGF